MSAWDTAWLLLTTAGLIATSALVADSLRDMQLAPEKLRPLARQLYRHELLRLLKQSLLLAGVILVFWRDKIGDEALIQSRNAIMATVATILGVNSLWDLSFRVRFFRRPFREAMQREMAGGKLQDATDKHEKDCQDLIDYVHKLEENKP
jgi:hypothetical protein